MSRFTDSPYFLLKDFMRALVAPPNPEYLQSDIINMSAETLYTDVLWIGGVTNYTTSSPYVDTLNSFPGFDELTDDATLFTHDDIIWNGWIERSPTDMYYLAEPDGVGVLMRGMEKSIIVDGGQYIDLWAKVDDYGFVPVRLRPIYEDPLEKVYFRFDEVEIQTLNYDGTIIEYDSDMVADEPYFDSDYVSIQTYDYTYDSVFSGGQTLDPGTEIYFRKDSGFHDWLKNDNKAKAFYQDEFETDFVLRNYVNTDKLFIYFGTVYPSPKDNISDPDRHQIVYYGLKDWIQRALPPNNRKELFIEFLDTYFDMVYSEGYQLLKDVWSLRDAMECNETFLAYVPTFYGVKRYDDIPSWFADIYREYARDCVWLLKRKGTYASMYVIYDLFCRNSSNIFNVLERWQVRTIIDTPASTDVELAHTIPSPRGIEFEQFGISVASSTTYTIASTPYSGVSGTGTVHIFNNSTGALLHTIDNPDDFVSDNDVFGNSVGISETYSIVGAPNEDELGQSNSGKAYIFNNVSGNLLHTLDNPNDFNTPAGDQFGDSVAIEETLCIVGAYSEDAATGSSSGKAYIFNNSTGVLVHTIDNPNDYGTEASDFFGDSVDISTTYSIVGAWGEDTAGNSQCGIAYVFDNATGNLVHTVPNPAEDGGNQDYFGYDVAITDTYFVVGAWGVQDDSGFNSGKAYIYDTVTGNLLWTLDNPNVNGTSGDQFGKAVDISDTLTVVGARYEGDDNSNAAGKAYVFDNATGALVKTLDNPRSDSGSTYYAFGWDVGISDTTISVGSPEEEIITGNQEYAGYTYIFDVDITEAVSSTTDTYADHIYTGQYRTDAVQTLGAGSFWYGKYDTANYPDGYLSTSNERLTPFYRADLDLSIEPLTSLKIMPKQIAENLYCNWEMMRPIHRQAEYNFIFSPYTDLTGSEYTIYESPNKSQAVTKSIANILFDSDSFIFIQRDEEFVWYVEHGLNTSNIIISAWDDTFKKMIPDAIEVLDDNAVQLNFSIETVGLVIITKAYKPTSPYSEVLWRLKHGYSREEVIVQFRNTATNLVEYPTTVDVFDKNTVHVTGLEPGETYEGFIQRGLTDGESIEEGGTILSDTIWNFGAGGVFNGDTGLWEWSIEHGYEENVFMVNCYDLANELIIPADIDVSQVDDDGNPKVVVSFKTNAFGFAAIDHIGDAVSFYGTVPRNAAGTLVPVEWRLTVETDEDVYTFIQEGTQDANRFANYSKTVHYWDGDRYNKTFPYGTTLLQEEDDLWYYYTFKVTDEALKQLNIKDYDILSIEIANTGIRRAARQRIVFSRLSGIYKPEGVNFIGFFRIFKNPDGFASTLLDEYLDALLDEDSDALYV